MKIFSRTPVGGLSSGLKESRLRFSIKDGYLDNISKHDEKSLEEIVDGRGDDRKMRGWDAT